MKRRESLRLQLIRLIMTAILCGIAVFSALKLCSDHFIREYFPDSRLQAKMTDSRAEKFSKYITKNNIASTESKKILEWSKKQPMVLMEIYRNNRLIFNSNYYNEGDLSEQNIEITYYDWYSYYEIEFADGTAELLIYSDDTYLLRFIATIAKILISFGICVMIVMLRIKRTVNNIYKLYDDVEAIGNGDFMNPVAINEKNELGMLAKGLDNMRLAILEHNEKEVALLVQNHDMITGLSHDLRTPLTKLMIYSEIIRCRRYKNEEQLNKYLDTICENVEQMKEISEHLLQYSLMQKETSDTHIQPSFIQSSIEGILIEMVDYLCHHGFVVDCEINWQPVRIEVVDFYLRRIFDNITSNIEKYGDSSKPVYIRHIYTEKYAGFSFENTVAGHSSDVESTNVGLVNLNSMLSHMNGKCVVDTANGRYELGVMFRVFE